MKAKILKIGYIDEDGNPKGFHFDSEGIGIEITSGNKILYGGYTTKELLEIIENERNIR